MQEFESSLELHGNYSSLDEDAIKEASKRAHMSTNEQLHATDFDDTLSGTTAISVLLKVSRTTKCCFVFWRPTAVSVRLASVAR